MLPRELVEPQQVVLRSLQQPWDLRRRPVAARDDVAEPFPRFMSRKKCTGDR
nr:hypothetical protein [Conexibacter woesei]